MEACCSNSPIFSLVVQQDGEPKYRFDFMNRPFDVREIAGTE